jgi:hypothetical protein
MCSEFKNCTGFVANSNSFGICTGLIDVSWLKPTDNNNYLNLYRAVQLLVSTVLGQPIPIIIFLPKRLHFSYCLNGIGLTANTKYGLPADIKDVFYNSVLPDSWVNFTCPFRSCRVCTGCSDW